jgi:hypothetical protein
MLARKDSRPEIVQKRVLRIYFLVLSTGQVVLIAGLAFFLSQFESGCRLY